MLRQKDGKAVIEAFRKKEDARHGGKRKLEPHTSGSIGIGQQDHTQGCGQGCEGIVFPVDHRRDEQKALHHGGPHSGGRRTGDTNKKPHKSQAKQR